MEHVLCRKAWSLGFGVGVASACIGTGTVRTGKLLRFAAWCCFTLSEKLKAAPLPLSSPLVSVAAVRHLIRLCCVHAVSAMAIHYTNDSCPFSHRAMFARALRPPVDTKVQYVPYGRQVEFAERLGVKAVQGAKCFEGKTVEDLKLLVMTLLFFF